MRPERSLLPEKTEPAAEPRAPEREAPGVAPYTDFRFASGDPRAAGPQTILSLQRAIGNRAVQRLLNIGKPNDPFERQADQVAAAVRGNSTLFSQPDAGGSELPRPDSEFESRLNRSNGNGNPLPMFNRSQLEPILGADLSGVRVHTGPEAALLSRSVDAQAFTFGNHIYFDSGRYDPGTSQGQELLAHEATHVVQQGTAPVAIRRRTVRDLEREFASQAIDLDSVITSKSARTFKSHPREEREEAAERFHKKHGQQLLPWLKVNARDKVELVRSFAWVVDGRDSFPHVDLALAAIAGAAREAPTKVLESTTREGRKVLLRRYESTYGMLSPDLDLDLLTFYGSSLNQDFEKCMALIDHDLTDAEHLYFMGVGRKTGGDIEAPNVINFIRERWTQGGYEALADLDRDWANYVHMDRHYKWGVTPLSPFYLYDAVLHSLTDEKHRRVIRPILKAYEAIKYERKIRPQHPLEDDLNDDLLSAYQAMTAAGKAGDEEQTRDAMLLYHRIWRRYLAAKGIQDNPELHKRLEDRYRQEAVELPTGSVKSLSPLRKALLNPEDRLAELHALSVTEFEKVITSAWLNDRPLFDLVAASQRGPAHQPLSKFSGFDEVRFQDTRTDAVLRHHKTLPGAANNRLAALLAPALNEEERGYRRLLLEFNVKLGAVRDVGDSRADGDLEDVYRFLSLPGMTPAFRTRILQVFAVRSIDANGSSDPVPLFLRYIHDRFEGTGGRWYVEILDLLAPAVSREERAARLRMKKNAGRSDFAGKVREKYDGWRGQGRDFEGGSDAGIENVTAGADKEFGAILADEHGVSVGKELDSLLYSIANARIQELHAREDEAALAVANAVSLIAEGLLSVLLTPAIGSVVGVLAEQVTREVMLGTANTAISAGNAVSIAMAGLTGYLASARDLRLQSMGPISNDITALMKLLKRLDRPGLNISEKTQTALRHVAASIQDEAAGILMGALMNAVTLNPTDAEQMKKNAEQALARVAGRSFGRASTVVTDFAEAAFSDRTLTMDAALQVAAVSLSKSAVSNAASAVGGVIAHYRTRGEHSPAERRDPVKAHEELREDAVKKSAIHQKEAGLEETPAGAPASAGGVGSAAPRLSTAAQRPKAHRNREAAPASLGSAVHHPYGAGETLAEIPDSLRLNEYQVPHAQTKVSGSGAVIQIARDIHFEREFLFGFAPARTVIVIAHGNEGISTFGTGKERGDRLTVRQVAELVREVMPEGGDVLLFQCYSAQAAQSLRRELGGNYLIQPGSALPIAAPGKRPEPVEARSDLWQKDHIPSPETGFSSVLPERGTPAPVRLSETSGVTFRDIGTRSFLYRAGVRGGDVVYEADHQRVDSLEDLMRIVNQGFRSNAGKTTLQVLRDGKVLHPDMYHGVYVENLDPKGRLYAAGIRDGDVINGAIDNGFTPIRSEEAFQMAINRGSPARLGVMRNGKKIFFDVAEEDGLSTGVRVKALDSNGPAYASGVRVGDVIHGVDGHEVSTSADLERALSRTTGRRTNTSAKLKITRGQKVLEIEYEWKTAPSESFSNLVRERGAAEPRASEEAVVPVHRRSGIFSYQEYFEAAGILAGDVVYQVGQKPVRTMSDLETLFIEDYTSHQTRTIVRVRRGNEFLEFKVHYGYHVAELNTSIRAQAAGLRIGDVVRTARGSWQSKSSAAKLAAKHDFDYLNPGSALTLEIIREGRLIEVDLAPVKSPSKLSNTPKLSNTLQ